MQHHHISEQDICACQTHLLLPCHYLNSIPLFACAGPMAWYGIRGNNRTIHSICCLSFPCLAYLNVVSVLVHKASHLAAHPLTTLIDVNLVAAFSTTSDSSSNTSTIYQLGGRSQGHTTACCNQHVCMPCTCGQQTALLATVNPQSVTLLVRLCSCAVNTAST